MMKVNQSTLPIVWNDIVAFEINQALWQTTYCPRSYAKMVIVNEVIYLNMFCEEMNPKATYTKLNDPVYKDSCLEAFINFDYEHTHHYLNIEVNALGTMCIEIGDRRRPRVKLEPNFKPIPYKNEDGWGFIIEIPLAYIKQLYGTIGNIWKANFYKCGDDCEQMHFLSWNKIETETPNFHCPEYFGSIKVN